MARCCYDTNSNARKFGKMNNSFFTISRYNIMQENVIVSYFRGKEMAGNVFWQCFCLLCFCPLFCIPCFVLSIPMTVFCILFSVFFKKDFLTCMHQHVAPQSSLLAEPATTEGTSHWPGSAGRASMVIRQLLTFNNKSRP